ncbi:hypothetical protein JTB14_020601 [Gonioctena quinquepunctata]|nr:hypothetical protein JTB14_020601 [Gonioctena quinquepunctata]
MIFHPQCALLKDSDVRIINSKADQGYGWTCSPCRTQLSQSESLQGLLQDLFQQVNSNYNQLSEQDKKLNQILSILNEKGKNREILNITSENDNPNAETINKVQTAASADKKEIEGHVFSSSEVAAALASVNTAISTPNETKTVINRKSSSQFRYTTQRSQKNYNKPKITGTADIQDDKYLAVKFVRRTWIHVSGFHPNLSVEDMLHFLSNTFKNGDFSCYEISSKHSNPKFGSFKNRSKYFNKRQSTHSIFLEQKNHSK